MCVVVGCILQPRRAAGESGVPGGGEAGAGPQGVSGPRALAAKVSVPPGDRGAGAAGAAGLRAAGAGGGIPARLRSLKHAARGWPGASSTKALPEKGGIPSPPPLLPSPPTQRPRGTCPTTTPPVRQGKLCSASAAPSQPGRVSPQQPVGHSSPPPGAR